MSRNQAYHTILKAAGRFFMLALMMTIPIIAMRIDVMVLNNNIGEVSVTEATQQIFLAMTLGCFWYITRKSTDLRYFGFLACGFFACMLLRELDSYFDDLLPGTWKGPVIITATYCIYKASRNIDKCLEGFVRFIQCRHFTTLCLGLALLLVFSRLQGMSSYWHYLLGDNLGAVKSSIEESTELMAYCVLLYSGLSYLSEFKASQEISFATQKQEAIDGVKA